MGFIRSPLINVIQENFITRPNIKHWYLWMISESCSKGKFMYINSLSLDPQAPEFFSGAFKIQNKKNSIPTIKSRCLCSTEPLKQFLVKHIPCILGPLCGHRAFVFDNLICLSEVDKAYSTNLGTQCLWPANVFCPWALVIFAWASAFLSISHNMYGKRDLLFS